MPIRYQSNLSDACGASTTPANETPEQPQATNDHCSLSSDRLDTIGANNKDLPPLPTTIRLRNDIFFTDAPKPMVRWATLADHRGRIESTQQLVFCASLMLNGPLLPIVERGTTEVSVSNDAECAWLIAMQKNPLARAHIRWLLSKVVAEFVKISSPESSAISEVVILGPALRRADYRALLSFFIERFEQIPLQNIDILGGLVQLVQSASPGFLVDDDLVRILKTLRQRLESTCVFPREHVYPLVFAVAKVLEVMVTCEVKGLNRKRDHQSLLTALCNLQGVEDDEVLKFHVNYAHQTLLYLPDDETSWQAFLRYAESLAVKVPGVARVFKLDPNNALAAVERLQQVAGNVVDVERLNIDGLRTLKASAMGTVQAGKRVYWSNEKEAWFLTLQAAYVFVREGRLVDFNKLVCKADCRFDANFQLGVCQILGEIASGQLWDVASRRRAIDFLGEFYKVGAGRNGDIKIQRWIVSILSRISKMSLPPVSEPARALLANLKEEQAADTEDCHPFHFYLPLPMSSPLLGRVQNIPDVELDVEYALACIESRSLHETLLPFSIPPRAKATLSGSNDNSFPLMERVHEFLKSNRQVFLLLGDSGSGKSTFCRQLEHELWDNYKNGSRIPLFIDLSTIENPDSDLIEKFLRNHNIEDHRMQEIKWHRQLLLICDGYDESHLTANLYNNNQLSRLNEVKMVVSCRNTFLSRAYDHRFRPLEFNRYMCHAKSPTLFEEATITPFTEDDIKDFITHYIMDRTTKKPLECVSVPSQEEYLRQLRVIPNVMDLAKNPFLLTLALEALPSLSADALDNTNLEATRLDLYDRFTEEWFRVNVMRIVGARLSPESNRAFERLHEAGFEECARDFSIQLATAIYVKNGRIPFVEYIHRMDNKSWKAEFFGEDPETILLREASPLSRAGTQHRFIHTSLLNYFVSLGISDVCISDDDDSGDSGGHEDDCQGDGSTLSGGGGTSFGGGGNSSGGNGNSSGGGGNSSGGGGNSSGGGGNSSGGSSNSSGGNRRSTGDNHSSTSGNDGTSDRVGGSGEGIGGSKGDGDDPQRRNDDTWSKRKGRSHKSRASTSSELLTKLNLFKTPAVLEFLVERAQADPRFKKHMLMVIEQSKSLNNPDMTGANAITILFRSGERFYDIKLDGVRVPIDYILEEGTESITMVTPRTGVELVDVLKALEAPVIALEALSYSQTTSTATLTIPAPLSNEAQSTQPPLSLYSNRLPPTLKYRSYDSISPPGSQSGKTRFELSRMLGPFESEHNVTTNEPTTSLNSQSSSKREKIPSPIAPPYDRYSSLSSPATVKRVPKDIFPKNHPAPTCKVDLPRPKELVNKTEQLVYCNAVINQGSPPSSVTVADQEAQQKSALGKAEQEWLAEIQRDPMELDHMRLLAKKMVDEFVEDVTKESTEIAEIVTLGPVLDREHYRRLLTSIIKDFNDAAILDANLLQGLVQLVQSASAKFLEPDDLVKILSILRIRLEGTHQQSSEHPYRLTLAVSGILDVMAEHKVGDLKRVVEHEPLFGVLSGL
ncbi:hypothetical protein BGX24_009313, partial [Mortierella sp. AD032]